MSKTDEKAVAETTKSEDSSKEPGFLDTVAAAGKMIGKSWVESDQNMFIKDYYGGTDETAVRSIVSDPFDYKKLQEETQTRLNQIDQSGFPPKNGFHSIGGIPVCTENAIIKCAMGSVFSKLHVMEPTRSCSIGTGIKNRYAVVTDFVPGVNFDGFGACWNILNPSVAAATLAASIAAGCFVLTPMPCLATMVPSPWVPMQYKVIDRKCQFVLTQNCLCTCWGLGFINFVHCGQGLDPSPPGLRDGEGNLDWHAVTALAVNIIGSGVGGAASIFSKGAEVAAAARAAEAASLVSKGAMATADAAKAAEMAATMMNVAKTAGNVAKGADYLSNGLTIGDGINYLAEGNTAEGLLNISLGGLGAGMSLKGDLADAAKGATGYRDLLNGHPELQKEFDTLTVMSSDSDALKKIVKENPDIFGDASKLSDSDLERVINGDLHNSVDAKEFSLEQVKKTEDDVLSAEITTASKDKALDDALHAYDENPSEQLAEEIRGMQGDTADIDQLNHAHAVADEVGRRTGGKTSGEIQQEIDDLNVQISKNNDNIGKFVDEYNSDSPGKQAANTVGGAMKDEAIAAGKEAAGVTAGVYDNQHQLSDQSDEDFNASRMDLSKLNGSDTKYGLSPEEQAMLDNIDNI